MNWDNAGKFIFVLAVLAGLVFFSGILGPVWKIFGIYRWIRGL